MKNSLIKALVVDDEKHCRDSLKACLAKVCPQVKIIHSVDSAAEARKLVKGHSYDVIFLDVEMPHEDGLSFIDSIDSLEFPVIFTTAHNTYALKAIKSRALDYLLKPINKADLALAINKLYHKEKKPTNISYSKVPLPTLEGLVFNYPSEIIRCEADGAYTHIYMQGNSLIVSQNIGVIENILRPYGFFRIHKSYLINLNHIKQYIKGRGGSVIMADNAQLEVSRRKREDFLLAVSQ